jgi:hypothetical protein
VRIGGSGIRLATAGIADSLPLEGQGRLGLPTSMNIIGEGPPARMSDQPERVPPLTSSAREATEMRQLHGFLRGSVVIPDDVDLTAPVLDPAFAVEQGRLSG